MLKFGWGVRRLLHAERGEAPRDVAPPGCYSSRSELDRDACRLPATALHVDKTAIVLELRNKRILAGGGRLSSPLAAL